MPQISSVLPSAARVKKDHVPVHPSHHHDGGDDGGDDADDHDDDDGDDGGDDADDHTLFEDRWPCPVCRSPAPAALRP